MYYNKVEICGINTSKLKVLTDEEKRELLIRSHNGDEAARQELINGNLRLVLSIIQRFSARKENPDDLFQVGCIGLVKAVDNFNIELDVKFSTYAVPMIIGEIRRYLRDNNAVRISRSVRELAYRALQVREELIAANEKEPTVDEIAARLGEKRDGDGFRMLIATGDAIDTDLFVRGNPLKVKFDVGNKKLRDVAINQGFEHHYSMVYGDITEELLDYCRIMDIEPVVLK